MAKFLKVRCDCGHEQIVFERAAMEVKCLACGKVLARPTGGKIALEAKVIQILEDAPR